MGVVGITFGLSSAAVLVIAALFSTRHNRNVSAFLFVMWGATKVWNFKSGTDAQIYLDTGLAFLCGLLCVVAMHRERRSIWPLITLGVMALMVGLNAAYADNGRDLGPQVKFAHQLASNVLYGTALLVNALPGTKNGAVVVRRVLLGYSVRSPRRPVGAGWGREAPSAISKRRIKAR